MRKLYNGFTEEGWAKVCADPYFKPSLDAMVARAESYIETPPPQIKFTDIHAFVTTGNRSEFEKAYGNLNSRVDSFFMAYMITKDDKYIDHLANAIWNVCDLETWALPAHVKESVSLERRHSWLELVSCNQGRRLGEMLALMEDKLPELVVRRLKNELRERIIEPYKKYTGSDGFWWRRGESNWSAVCVAGVLGGFLYAATPEEIEEQIPEMCESAEAFLRSYDDEGCCKEGYGYWSYGFGYFCIFAEMLKNYTEGRIDYFKRPKVHAIAKFQENISMNENQCVRFSDCGEYFRPPLALSHFLKRKYPDVQIPPIPAPTGPVSLMDYFWIDPTLADCKMEPTNYIYHETQWFIHKGNVYNFACKAGYNGEPHNHNDIGSFLISKNGRVTFTDPGGGEYTRQYFSNERYTVLEPSARSHSIPVINGCYQVGGSEKSKIYVEKEHEYAFSMENGYKIETLKSLKRHFVCDEDVLTMTDTYEFTEMPESVVERFSTLVEPKIEEGRVTVGATVLEYNADELEISLSTDTCVRSRTLSETLYLIDLKVKNLKESFSLTFKFS